MTGTTEALILSSDPADMQDGWGENGARLEAAMRDQHAALEAYRRTDEAASQWARLDERDRVAQLPASQPCEPSMIADYLMSEPGIWKTGRGIALVLQRLALAAYRRTGGRARLWQDLDRSDAVAAKQAEQLQNLRGELALKRRMGSLVRRAKRAGLSVRFLGGVAPHTQLALRALGAGETFVGLFTFEEAETAVLRLIGGRHD